MGQNYTPEEQAKREQAYVTSVWRSSHGPFSINNTCLGCTASVDALATHCMGSSTFSATDNMVRQGLLDFIDGRWIHDPLLILSMRATKKQENPDGA